MQISRIDDMHQFDQLKTAWEAVYSADPHANIFASWMWLRGWFEIAPSSWFVLAIQPDKESSYVAFLPLIMRGLRIYKFSPIRVLHMGGAPLAFYTGLICLPEYEEEALAAFALYVQHQLGWDSFQMEQVLDPRLDLFLKYFPCEKFNVQKSHGMPSLYIPLPDSWDRYLRDLLGSKRRRNLRRSFRQVEGHNEYRITYTQADTVGRDIEVLLKLWQRRWGPKPMAHWHRDILHHFFENNALWLSVLWDGTTPVAARAGIIDRPKKTFYAYVICYDAKYAKLSPGRAMVGYSIRYAIESGFQAYDFLVGADAHKFSFGARQRSTKNVIIARRGLRSTLANLVVNLTGQLSDLLVKILGKVKRIEMVKQIWFWLSDLVQQVKR